MEIPIYALIRTEARVSGDSPRPECRSRLDLNFDISICDRTSGRHYQPVNWKCECPVTVNAVCTHIGACNAELEDPSAIYPPHLINPEGALNGIHGERTFVGDSKRGGERSCWIELLGT